MGRGRSLRGGRRCGMGRGRSLRGGRKCGMGRMETREGTRRGGPMQPSTSGCEGGEEGSGGLEGVEGGTESGRTSNEQEGRDKKWSRYVGSLVAGQPSNQVVVLPAIFAAFHVPEDHDVAGARVNDQTSSLGNAGVAVVSELNIDHVVLAMRSRVQRDGMVERSESRRYLPELFRSRAVQGVSCLRINLQRWILLHAHDSGQAQHANPCLTPHATPTVLPAVENGHALKGPPY
eukprot:766987-Hanusia_phi.AAC.2